MSAQDRTEKVLRNLHVMVSKSEIYELDDDKIIIDRDKIVGLLKELNKCIYAMMEEYEMTRESRDQAEREFQKHADEIIYDANRKAEDIYAASVMYTDEALGNVQEIMAAAEETVRQLHNEMEERMEAERLAVRQNQTELKAQLQDLADTEKYMMLISERNREIQKEKEKEQRLQRRKEAGLYADRQTEVRVDTEVLKKLGLAPEEEPSETNEQTQNRLQAGERPQTGAQTQAGEEGVTKEELQKEEASLYADRQTQVRVNEETLKKLGLQSAAKTPDQDKKTPEPVRKRVPRDTGITGDDPITPMNLSGVSAEETETDPFEEELIRLDLDADYFKWKEEQDAEIDANAAKERASKRRGKK